MRILTAAVKTSDGVIHILPRPYRHADIVNVLYRVYYQTPNILGFLMDNGEFMDRKQAGVEAIKSGQIKEMEYQPTLYTEDLW